MSDLTHSPAMLVSLRRLVRKVDRPIDVADEVVTAFRDGQVTLRSLRRADGFTFSDLEAGYQGVQPGDLVIHGLDAFAGAVGVSDSRGKCSPVYHVCEPIGGTDLRYIAYALRFLAQTGFLLLQAANVRQRAVDFRNWETLAQIGVPTIETHRQRAVADYLDAETSRQQGLSDALGRAVELDKERLASVIDHEVVSGNTAPEPRRLRVLADLMVDGCDYGPRPIVSLEHIRSLTGEVADLAVGPRPDAGFVSANPGDVLFAKLRPYLRKVWRVTQPVYASTELLCLRPRAGIDPGWLAVALRSPGVIHVAVSSSDGTKMPRTSWERLAEARLPVLTVPQQRSIVIRVEAEIERHSRLVQAVERQLGLLQERREAAIAAAVTGQIEIPGVAA